MYNRWRIRQDERNRFGHEEKLNGEKNNWSIYHKLTYTPITYTAIYNVVNPQ